MRIVFMGTPEFAIPSLVALSKTHQVVGVVTQPDRPRGRGGKVLPSAVKAKAIELGLPVYQFEKIRLEGVETLQSLRPDVMITAAYGQILSDEILEIAPHGVINVHGSILPDFRGSSPVQHAILRGDKETGVTIMQTAREVDSGDIIKIAKTPIREFEGTESVLRELAELGAKAIVEVLDEIEKGNAKFIPQDHKKATFCKMLNKSDAVIDWSKSADEISRVIRAFDYMGASTTVDGAFCKVYSPEIVEMQGEMGKVLSCSDKTGVVVGCGKGALRIGEILLAGGKRAKTTDLVRGRKIGENSVFGK